MIKALSILLLSFSLVSQAEEARRFDLRLAGGALVQSQQLIKVTQGEAVQIWWYSDQALALHLHGYDISLAVQPQVPAVMAFKARATGRFPISRHGEGHDDHQTLLYLEVHPR
ncbi:hypothetical protein [Gallaecimonas sp. GXIMD4217]|uniref:hypothetical protein n=1 Tax=Gallaecimonas sp. GXIMD4217 TaxID=3131927 RepID=UPI00311ACD69